MGMLHKPSAYKILEQLYGKEKYIYIYICIYINIYLDGT
jgi:hypothetical protein